MSTSEPRWAPGDSIVERGIVFDAVVFARPQTVVAHTDGLIASWMRVGTKYFGALPTSRETIFDELGRGELRWGERTWEQHNVLILVRPGDHYSVQGFWDEGGKFVCWYINLQEPLTWTPLGYDTRDNALDLIVGEDLASWIWKDEHELEMGVKMGLFSAQEARMIRGHGEAALDLMKRGEIWWREWRGWEPDPSLPLPVLPDGWDVVQR